MDNLLEDGVVIVDDVFVILDICDTIVHQTHNSEIPNKGAIWCKKNPSCVKDSFNTISVQIPGTKSSLLDPNHWHLEERTQVRTLC